LYLWPGDTDCFYHLILLQYLAITWFMSLLMMLMNFYVAIWIGQEMWTAYELDVVAIKDKDVDCDDWDDNHPNCLTGETLHLSYLGTLSDFNVI
jgi:hypothetical protein